MLYRSRSSFALWFMDPLVQTSLIDLGSCQVCPWVLWKWAYVFSCWFREHHFMWFFSYASWCEKIYLWVGFSSHPLNIKLFNGLYSKIYYGSAHAFESIHLYCFQMSWKHGYATTFSFLLIPKFFICQKGNNAFLRGTDSGSLNTCPHQCPSAPTLLVHIEERYENIELPEVLREYIFPLNKCYLLGGGAGKIVLSQRGGNTNNFVILRGPQTIFRFGVSSTLLPFLTRIMIKTIYD